MLLYFVSSELYTDIQKLHLLKISKFLRIDVRIQCKMS